MGFFARKRADRAALHEMPVAPGVGKVRAHAAAGRVNVRFDTVKGPSPEAAFERMLGLKSTAAIEMGKRAWAEGVPFRAFAPLSEADGAVKEGAEKRAVKRLDLGERVSVLAVEAEGGGALGRAVPVYWTDLTHTCEPNWVKRFADRAGAWVEGNVDSPVGSEPLGFAAVDFAWYGPPYLRGAAMPLEIAAVAETVRGTPPPQDEAVKAVVYPGGKASEPDEFDIAGTVLASAEARYEGGMGVIVKLEVKPIEWIDLWIHQSLIARIPKPGEGVEARARLFALWAGQRTADLAVG